MDANIYEIKIDYNENLSNKPLDKKNENMVHGRFITLI